MIDDCFYCVIILSSACTYMQDPDVLRLALGVREGIVNISVAGDDKQVRESQLQSMLQSETMDESSVTQDEDTVQLREANVHVEPGLASPMSEFARADSSVESESDEAEDAGGGSLEVHIHHIIMHAGYYKYLIIFIMLNNE